MISTRPTGPYSTSVETNWLVWVTTRAEPAYVAEPSLMSRRPVANGVVS